MRLARWTPFDAMSAIERDVQGIFDRFFSSTPAIRGGEQAWTFTWRPRVDIFREDDQLVVRAELPGIDPEKDLEVMVEGNVLHIKGQRQFDREVADEDLYLSERFYGTFERDILLPEGVDADKLEASYDDGVLTIVMPLPKALERHTKKVAVTAGGSKQLGRSKKVA